MTPPPFPSKEAAPLTRRATLTRLAALSAGAGAWALPLHSQAAIDTARPGDILRLRSGIYRGSIVIDKAITIEEGTVRAQGSWARAFK